MALRTRRRTPPTEDWQQLTLLLDTAGQRSYEVIRPVVVFGEPVSARATATQTPARTVYRYVARFEQAGLAGLEPPPRLERHQRVPAEMRQALLDLKREYPPLHFRELATICWVRFGQRLSHNTVRRLLAEQPPPPRVTRRFPPYHAIPDAFTRRRTVLQLHMEGWNKQSIAGYLETTRHTVDDVLRRWAEEQFAGLHDKSRRPKQTLQAMTAVRQLQENPLRGEYRISTALKRLGIELSPRTCGRILALNRKLYGLAPPPKAPHEPKPMPFAAQYRHQIWSTDLRYIDHHLGGGKVYCVSILDNYSRAILASELSRSQNLSVYLRVLRQALERYGAPAVIVSDRGGIFLAKRAEAIYDLLGIQKAEIDKRQPWQNYIESNFNVQRRLSDWDFGKATTWEELLLAHEQWLEAFNHEEHFAHRQREDGRHSPRAVLDWVRGREVNAVTLAQAFAPVQFARRADRSGYIRFRHWRLYAERGLERQPIGVWLTGERLTVVYSDEPLAQYGVSYERDQHQLRAVREERLYPTPFQSPQPLLWPPREGEWLTVLRLTPNAPRRRRVQAVGEQRALFD